MLFKLEEFVITGRKSIDVDVADKLYWYHIMPMIPVREKLDTWISASENSGYRPKWWEKKKGRSGKSQHTFEGKGAVDWTCGDFPNRKDEFLNLIIEHTDYTRIAIYNTFIHCDYKKTNSDKREVYSSTASSEWTLIETF